MQTGPLVVLQMSPVEAGHCGRHSGHSDARPGAGTQRAALLICPLLSAAAIPRQVSVTSAHRANYVISFLDPPPPPHLQTQTASQLLAGFNFNLSEASLSPSSDIFPRNSRFARRVLQWKRSTVTFIHRDKGRGRRQISEKIDFCFWRTSVAPLLLVSCCAHCFKDFKCAPNLATLHGEKKAHHTDAYGAPVCQCKQTRKRKTEHVSAACLQSCVQFDSKQYHVF